MYVQKVHIYVDCFRRNMNIKLIEGKTTLLIWKLLSICLTLKIPILLNQIRNQTSIVSCVILKSRLFDNSNHYINIEELTKTNRNKSIAKPGQEQIAMYGGDTSLKSKLFPKFYYSKYGDTSKNQQQRFHCSGRNYINGNGNNLTATNAHFDNKCISSDAESQII